MYNTAWVVLLLFWPGTILLKPPPLFGVLIAGIGGVGVAFAVGLGYLGWSQWWMPVFNDLVWLPPLIRLWKQTGRL